MPPARPPNGVRAARPPVRSNAMLDLVRGPVTREIRQAGDTPG
jgi:hypothetical protein